MKEKVVIAVLSLICIASVACNIYQYNKLNTSRQQLVDARMQLESMTNSYTDLDAQLTAMQEELDALNINMADKQSEIDSLAKENSDLVNSISELEESIEETKKIAEEKAIETAKAEQTASTQTTETASTTQSTASNQNVDTAAQERMLQKAAENGFAIGGYDTEYVDHVVERDMSGIQSGNWE